MLMELPLEGAWSHVYERILFSRGSGFHPYFFLQLEVHANTVGKYIYFLAILWSVGSDPYMRASYTSPLPIELKYSI